MSRLCYRAFSTGRPARDLATCQLLGRFGSTPTTFKTRDGRPAVRYLFAVNRVSQPSPSSSSSKGQDTGETSWFNVVSFDERAIERLTSEDLKGAKALVDAAIDIKSRKDDESGKYFDQVSLRQTGLHIIERNKKTTTTTSRGGDKDQEAHDRAALEDSFSV